MAKISEAQRWKEIFEGKRLPIKYCINGTRTVAEKVVECMTNLDYLYSRNDVMDAASWALVSEQTVKVMLNEMVRLGILKVEKHENRIVGYSIDARGREIHNQYVRYGKNQNAWQKAFNNGELLVTRQGQYKEAIYGPGKEEADLAPSRATTTNLRDLLSHRARQKE